MDNVRKNFQQTLEEIRQEMVQMAALVTEGIPRATEALLNGDLTDAQRIIEDDDPLDARAVELEELCYQQLALQQPMAGDLRGIVTAIRMISEIERSGDLVVNIAKGSRRIFGTELSARLRGLISQMGEESTRPIDDRAKAFLDKYTSKAFYVDSKDLALPGVEPAMRPFASHFALDAVMSRLAQHFEAATGEDLQNRRYMFKVEY